MKVLILQPVIPHYRVDFFEKVKKKLKEKVVLFASCKDDIGVNSVDHGQIEYVTLGEYVRFFGLIWQKDSWKVIRLASRKDVVVVNGNPRCISNWMVICLCRVFGYPVVWWGQGWSANTSWLSSIPRFVFMSLSSAIILYTEREKDKVPKCIPKRKLYYLNNGINNEEILRYREKYVAEERGKNILFIGRLTEKSRILDLISCLDYMAADVCIHVIGNAQGDIEELYNINNLKRVIFHGQAFNEEEISKVANICRVFVYPGDVGLSVVHAFNYGLPAILHDDVDHHMPEISCHKSGETGYSFKRGDVISLAHSIDCLINNADELDMMSKECIKKVDDDYNTKAMAERFVKVINKM